MKDGLTSITMVVDRSGSMGAVQQEAENGINHFIKEQKEVPGEALLTLTEFDTEFATLHAAVPIAKVGHYHLVPRGMTALLDAVGKAINETGEALAKLDEADRPETVIFVILTDGHENSSHEFTKARVREMIEHQQDAYKWQFTFLGADADAFDEAAQLGIAAGQTAHYAPRQYAQTMAAVSASVARTRATGDALSFTDGERKAMR